jgi:hypothetical protein
MWDDLARQCYLSRSYLKNTVYRLMYGGKIDPWLDAIVLKEMEKKMAATKTKDQADYVASTNSKEKCRACSMYRPGRCTLVKGLINPSGHCKYWVKK